MPGKNEIVAGIRLTGEKEFRQEITSINKSVSAMKSELKLVSAQYEGQANSLEALTAKDRILNQILEEQKRKAEATKKALENAQSGYEKGAASVEKLRQALEEQQSRTNGTNQAYESAVQRLKRMTDEGKSSERAMEKQKAVVGQLKTELDQQNKALEEAKVNLSKGEDAYQKVGNKVSDWKTKLNTAEAQLISANKQVKENAAYMEEAAESADGYAKSIDKFGNKVTETNVSIDPKQMIGASLIGKGVSLGVDAVKAGVEALAESMKDASSAASQLAASTGLSESAAKRYQNVMKSIKGDNFGESYQDIADVMSQVIQIIGELNDADMTEVTESAIALRDTFDMDVNESIRAVDVMMNTMGVDASKAFDLIAAGAQNGLNRSGELVDNLTEYGSLWGQAGFSAEQMFGILENGLDAGAYNLDKVNDFVKEFGISLSDGRIEDNLSSFSTGTQDLFQKWKNGEATSSEVFYSIISDLENMTNKQEALTIASNIWSALGEDNAMDVLAALNDTNDGYENVYGTMNKLKEIRYDNLSDSLERLGNVAQESILQPIGEKALPLITGAINAAADGLEDIFNPPKTELEEFIDEVEKSNDTVQELLENAQSTMEDAEMDVSNLEAYKQVLLDLSEQESLSEFQKYQLSSAVQALSGTVPGLADAFDAESGALKITNEELVKMFDNAEAVAMQTALIKAQEDTYAALAEATLNKARADSAAETALEALEKKQGELNEAYSSANGSVVKVQSEIVKLNSAYADAAKEQERANDQLEEANQQKEKEEKALKELEEQYGLTTNSLEENTQAAQEASEASDGYANSLNNEAAAAAKSQEAAEAQKSAMDNIVQAYESARSEIESSLQDKISLFDMFETSDGGEDLSVEKMTENLDSQIEAFRQYQQNLEAVKDHVGQEIAPEFMQYLESMGMDGANALKHILATFDEGDSGAEKVREMSDKWCEAMDMTEKMSEVGAANQVAYQAAMGELGSSEADFTALTDSINTAVSTAAEGWGGLSESTRQALDQTIETVRQCGIQIPEGLAEGIASGEISPENAIAQLQGSIQGSCEALVQIANESGIQIPEEITSGIEVGGQQAAEAYSGLIQLISQMAPDLYSAMSEGSGSGEMQSSVQKEVEGGASAIEGAAGTYRKNAQSLGAAMGEGIGTNLTQETSEAVQSAASGITANTEAYRQAGQQLGAAIAEGILSEQENIGSAISAAMSGSNASADSGAFEGMGSQIGDAIAKGIQGKKGEISAAISSAMSAEGVQAGGGFEALGTQIATGIASGITGRQGTIQSAAAAAVQLALDTVTQKKSAFGTAGSEAASQYALGIAGGAGSASSAAANVAASALGAVSGYTGSFVSVGYNISYGIASGISAGGSAAINAARNVAVAALAAAKSALGIHSPSLKFRNDVGKQIGAGMAFGIRDSASLASRAASRMSANVYSRAVSWLSKYKKANKTTIDDTVWFWQQIQKHTKAGTKAYTNAVRQELSYSIGNRNVANKILSNFGVSRTEKSGGKTVRKSTQDYYSDVYSAAEDYLKKYQTLHNMSTKQETAYWEGVRRRLKKGTDAWYDATAKINELKAQQEQEAKAALQTQASVQDDILNKYKVYYKVSAKAEMEYWKKARQQFKTGTDERIEADRKYLEALQEFYDQRKELDEEYAENSQAINDELKESVEELQDAYKEAVQSRKEDILSQMDLFEAWDSSGYDADTLLYNLKTQVAGLTLWEQQLEELGTKGVSEALMEELRQMGPDAAASIYSLNHMTKEQLDEYERLWQQRNDLAESQAVKDNEGLFQETNEEINKLRQDAQAELNALNAEYRAALSELNTGMTSDLSKLLDQAGKIGEDAVSGLIGGIKKASDSVEVYNSTTKVVNTVSTGLSELTQAGNVIGKDTLDSMLSGMLDNEKIESTSQKVIQSVKAAMEKASEEELQQQELSLQTQMQALNFSAIAVINDALSGYTPGNTVVNVDTKDMAEAIGILSAGVAEMVETISQLKVVLDTGEVVGLLQPEISRETAYASIRQNGGRL